MRLTRPLTVLALIAALTASGVALLATPAQAHPLGNFSVNQYAGLTLRPAELDVRALADIAEIPTLQEKSKVDTDGNGQLSPAEMSAYATSACRAFADSFAVTLDDNRLTWTITAPGYELKPGASGLSTSRLSCRLTAPATLTGTATLRVTNNYRSDRVGWRELTAKADGVRLNSTLPATSISNELTNYPRDLLTSAPDVRTATIQLGESGVAAAAPRLSAAAPGWLAAAQSRFELLVGGHLTPVVVALAFLLALLLGAAHAALPGHGKTVMAAYFAGRRGRIRDALAIGGTVTLSHTGGVLLIGILLTSSTALAGEKLLTWLAAASGILVTGVGIAMLRSALRARHRSPHTHPHADGSSHLNHAHAHHHAPSAPSPNVPPSSLPSPDVPSPGVPSPDVHSPGIPSPGIPSPGIPSPGIPSPGIPSPGVPSPGVHSHDGHPHGVPSHGDPSHGVHSHDGHSHSAPSHSGHSHSGHSHSGHSHSGHSHSAHSHDHRPGGRLGLAGIGLAGGLVPSPSALVVLLGAIGLGRTTLGVLLVLAYGIGMAGTLTAIGLLLVVAQGKLGGWVTRAGRARALTRLAQRLSAGAPTATAALVVLVGLGMGLRAVS